MLGQGKKYCLRTYGRQANERDSETLAGTPEGMNFTAMEHPEDVDLILMSTCAIRKNAEDRVLGEIDSPKRLKRKKSDLLFGLRGCMAQEEDVVAKLLEIYRHVNLILGIHNIRRLPELLYDVMVNGNRGVKVFSKGGDVTENLPVRRFGKHKTWVNIMYGYGKLCTCYIVPYTQGKKCSRMVKDVLEEIRILKAEGFREIMLSGQNVNSHGEDLYMEGDFAGLLEETVKTGIERIRFTTSHPRDFTSEMIDVIACHGDIMPFIHLSVQDGDSDILKVMGGRYTREQYPTLFHKIRERIPYCAISTGIIVGFPNETEERFRDMLSLVDECRFDNAFIFIYPPRERAPAVSMADNVGLAIKQRRLRELNKHWNLYAREKNEECLGSVVKVLVDNTSKKNPEMFSGYTETNKLVDFRWTTT